MGMGLSAAASCTGSPPDFTLAPATLTLALIRKKYGIGSGGAFLFRVSCARILSGRFGRSRGRDRPPARRRHLSGRRREEGSEDRAHRRNAPARRLRLRPP